MSTGSVFVYTTVLGELGRDIIRVETPMNVLGLLVPDQPMSELQRAELYAELPPAVVRKQGIETIPHRCMVLRAIDVSDEAERHYAAHAIAHHVYTQFGSRKSFTYTPPIPRSKVALYHGGLVLDLIQGDVAVRAGSNIDRTKAALCFALEHLAPGYRRDFVTFLRTISHGRLVPDLIE